MSKRARASVRDESERPLWLASGKFLAIEKLATSHLDHHMVGQRIHHRNANAMQSAARLIGAGIEFAAGMQGRHDDFEC